MKLVVKLSLVVALLIGCIGFASAQDTVLKIYHDADYSNHRASAESMNMGISTALAEINNQQQGYRIELVEKDHRGNSNRSKLHMQQFLKDPNALFILGGLHSPPYIKYRDFINQNQILLLVPWAAGGPITRYDKGDNWVYRLSIDDTKAGFRIASFAAGYLGCKAPHLLLEETPWGQSNYKTMMTALKKDNRSSPEVTWFRWNTKAAQARIMLRGIIEGNSDCVLFVGNAIEGEIFSNALASIDKPKELSFISHWGITGGNFQNTVKAEVRESINLHFIQTCFSFVSSKPTELSTRVLNTVKTLFAEKVKTATDIKAPPGFIHAYDLGKITIQAMRQIELVNDMKKNREALKAALENIQIPVEGLLKTYHAPFSRWSSDNQDAHEALGLEDFCMAKYLGDGSIKVIDSRQ